MKKLLSLMLVLAMVMSMTACGTAPAPSEEAAPAPEASQSEAAPSEEAPAEGAPAEVVAAEALNNVADDKAAEYLEFYFEIAPMTGDINADTFNAAVAKLNPDVKVEGELTMDSAIKAAVEVAGLKELALVYTAEKTARGTEGLTVSEENAPFVATAIEAGLASKDWDYSKVTGEVASELLYKAAEMAGMARNYLGNSCDEDIYREIQSAWATFGNFDDDKLSALGADLVIEGASTGYNLKFDGFNANFLPEYTLQYGHSSIKHAKQLIALLNSEGITAKVALEPKTSIYEYMVEWGDPTGVAKTPTYELRPIEGGRYLCYATEYDMKLEFNSIEEKNAFDAIVGKYAKKWDSNTDGDGNPTVALLAGAWWQPLYTSTVPMEDAENFTLIHDNVIRNGAYTIHPFSTTDGGEAIANVVKTEAPDLSVEVVDLYVNNAFYRYLTGASHE